VTSIKFLTFITYQVSARFSYQFHHLGNLKVHRLDRKRWWFTTTNLGNHRVEQVVWAYLL